MRVREEQERFAFNSSEKPADSEAQDRRPTAGFGEPVPTDANLIAKAVGSPVKKQTTGGDVDMSQHSSFNDPAGKK